ncbi:alpha-E domain-containing protein [Tamlana fucoidanivorans]|uniref:Alpha-E domain-containing protein n=1 Tax=Allotamlana fucoidanivorans TaxID=2583814 RepID=A0A5C4SN91_9FLAO|nr:alpha-E domain-containing protein [Tamlana fucoidanivorans]TNJ45639.1 alpha-E domain-containing protein [Tamlana fucoidanivorans]
MLARVADNLFWMSRYIERSEHVARYLRVNYFSSLDAPNELSQSRQFVLRSLLFMVGDPIKDDTHVAETDVLYNICLNLKKSYSIINCVKLARENANSSRDLISTELYEAINKFYHFVLNYSSDYLVTKGLYDFATHIIEFTAILKAKIRCTLLYDEVYSIINLGLNMERATQVIRIINAKYNDIQAIELKREEGALVAPTLEWDTLLRCVESYDMMRRFTRETPNSINTLDFLILNHQCPRSVINSLSDVAQHIQVLSDDIKPKKGTTAFLVNKIYAEYQYKYIEEIEVDFRTFIEKILNKLVEISKKMEEEFFYH